MTRSAPLALLLLSACARSEDASVVAETNDMAVERVRTPEEEEEEIAIGEWRETLQDDFSALEFGPAGAPALFSLRCDARRSVFLQRHGALATGDLPMMLVSVGSETRRLAVTSVAGTVPMLRASLAPSEEFIATLAGAVTPVIVRIGDAAPLVLPPSPSIGGFLSRCEAGPTAQTGGDERAEGNAAEANAAAPAEPTEQR